MIEFRCACGQKYRLSPTYGGKSIRCKKCGAAAQVPKAPVEDDSPMSALAALQAASFPEPSARTTPPARPKAPSGPRKSKSPTPGSKAPSPIPAGRQSGADKPKARSRPLLGLIAGGALVILAGAGGLGFWFVGSPSSNPKQASAKGAPPEAATESSAAVVLAKATAPPEASEPKEASADSGKGDVSAAVAPAAPTKLAEASSGSGTSPSEPSRMVSPINSVQTIVFVSQAGDDKAPGTEQQPLATLAAARDAVRRLRKQGAAGAIDVVVKPGIIRMTEPLVLEPEDSGTATGPTTYRAAPGGTVTLSGGVPITGWKRREGDLWVAPVPAELDFRLLRVGERWATRARHPNFDAKNPLAGGWLFADAITPAPAMGQPTTFMKFRGNDVPAYVDLSGSEVHIFIAWGWVNAIVPIGKIDPAQHRIDFAGKGASQDARAGNRYFIENVREALDAPGEWFLDKAKREVLYIPDNPSFAGDASVTVVAPRLDHLIRCAGDRAAGKFVEHVRFTGFQFTDTTHNLHEDYYTPNDACIRLSFARDVEVRGCAFSWCAGYAMKLGDRAEQCVLAECKLEHMGMGGVVMQGGTQDQAHHCSVVANRMEHLGLIYKHVAGVYVTSGSDHYIAHNRIADMPRYAISLKSQGVDNLAHRNVVEFNDISHANMETSDTGAIESLGYERQPSGNVFRHNRILDTIGMDTTDEGKIQTPHFSWGIYLDDGSSGTSVYGNIVARTTTGGICVHGGKDNVFENNILVDGRDRQIHLHPERDPMSGNRFVRNIVAYSRPEAEVFYLFQAWKKGQQGRFAESDFNLFWLTAGDLKTLGTKNTPNGPFAGWLGAGFDKNSKIADPKFVDPAKDDYRLSPDSPALALGFKPIPVDLIGPDGWTKRGSPLKAEAAAR
ncbi:MAG: right-handed parallel beta-helix repeat-containing protein [Planctomycetota bacterium]|nr:right-handed parallel beta-helix repeat-containing protein [Planctomycetota bacterium]